MKTIEQNFADWEKDVFGFGYGTGEEPVLAALKQFLGLCKDSRYDYRELEAELTPPVAWMLINTLCHAQIIEYGVSPRFAWLTPEGVTLQDFMSRHTVDELAIMTEYDDVCSRDACNCGPRGYQAGIKCHNPFWAGHH